MGHLFLYVPSGLDQTKGYNFIKPPVSDGPRVGGDLSHPTFGPLMHGCWRFFFL
jgi:hypothetical protein